MATSTQAALLDEEALREYDPDLGRNGLREAYGLQSPRRRGFRQAAHESPPRPAPPSLRAKKYEERTGLWQARINDDWRMFFTIEGDAYVLRAITPHSK
jgi:hypothetical protein